MRSTVVLLTGFSVAIVGAACSGDDDDDGAAALTSGQYVYTVASVPADACWESDAGFPTIGLTATLAVTVAPTSVALAAVDTAGHFVIPDDRTGPLDDDQFEGTFQDVTLHVTSACSILQGGSFSGDVTGAETFDLTTFYGFGVATMNSGGGVSNCTNAPANIYGGLVPFPAALRTNGTCGFGLNGTAVIP